MREIKEPSDEYNAWVRAKIRGALEDQLPTVPHAEAMRDMREMIGGKCTRMVGWHPPYGQRWAAH